LKAYFFAFFFFVAFFFFATFFAFFFATFGMSKDSSYVSSGSGDSCRPPKRE
jgi:hypothetical protein